jgi:rubredoxin
MDSGRETMTDEYIPEPVYCPSCGFFGMSDDCRYNECPNCGWRVRRERKGDEKEVELKKLKRWLVKKTGWHLSRNPKRKKGEGEDEQRNDGV